jgi:hypothetical protein
MKTLQKLNLNICSKQFYSGKVQMTYGNIKPIIDSIKDNFSNLTHLNIDFIGGMIKRKENRISS